MTPKQIAELRKESERWILTSTERPLVLRLFDEREALLEALMPIVERLDGDREFVIPDGGAEMLVAARAAITKAEAP